MDENMLIEITEFIQKYLNNILPKNIKLISVSQADNSFNLEYSFKDEINKFNVPFDYVFTTFSPEDFIGFLDSIANKIVLSTNFEEYFRKNLKNVSFYPILTHDVAESMYVIDSPIDDIKIAFTLQMDSEYMFITNHLLKRSNVSPEMLLSVATYNHEKLKIDVNSIDNGIFEVTSPSHIGSSIYAINNLVYNIKNKLNLNHFAFSIPSYDKMLVYDLSVLKDDKIAMKHSHNQFQTLNNRISPGIYMVE